MKLTRHRPDFVLFVVVILLVLIGLVNIYSASTVVAYETENNANYYFIRQLIWVVLGLFMMMFVMNITFTKWIKWSKPLFLLSYLLMVMVLIPHIGTGDANWGARRWLSIGFGTFQPSELAILSIVLYLSYLLSRKEKQISEPKASFWPSIILIGLGAGLIMLEPDMGTAVIFCICPFVVMYAAGVPKKLMRITTVVAVLVGIPLALYGYRGDRINAYFHTWSNSGSVNLTTYQIIQSLYAIGSGGLTGRGLGQSIEKFSYLPEPHTDFIFAILSEEWGFVGSIVVIGLFGILIWRCIHIANHLPDRFGALTCIGIATMIAVYVFINIGSVTKLLPVIGVPLPFISYGGTSLMVKLLAMGILLNISRFTVKSTATVESKDSEGQLPTGRMPIRTSRFDT